MNHFSDMLKARAIEQMLAEYEQHLAALQSRYELVLRQVAAIEIDWQLDYVDEASVSGAGVYLLHDPYITGLFKIGKTQDLAVRPTQISQTKLPFDFVVRMVHAIEEYAEAKPPTRREPRGGVNHYGSCHDVERLLHVRFADKRTRGEWFALDYDDVAWIKKQNAKTMQYMLDKGREPSDYSRFNIDKSKNVNSALKDGLFPRGRNF